MSDGKRAELEAQISAARAELAGTAEAIAERLDPKAQTDRTLVELRQRAGAARRSPAATALAVAAVAAAVLTVRRRRA